jgi:hypothetical protein
MGGSGCLPRGGQLHARVPRVPGPAADKHVHITTRCRPLSAFARREPELKPRPRWPSESWLAKYIRADDQTQVPAAIREAILNRAVFELEQRHSRRWQAGGSSR